MTKQKMETIFELILKKVSEASGGDHPSLRADKISISISDRVRQEIRTKLDAHKHASGREFVRGAQALSREEYESYTRATVFCLLLSELGALSLVESSLDSDARD
jgi:hypothetical protein